MQGRGAADVGEGVVVEAQLAPDRLGQLGDAVHVVAQLAVVLGRHVQQDTVDELVGAGPAAALVRVHPLVGHAQRLGGRVRFVAEPHHAV